MIVAKRTIDSTCDGSTTLFQLPHVYVLGSVVVFEKMTNTQMRGLTVNELGGEYIETLETPGDGSQLIILYDYNDESIEVTSATIDGFKPWDSKRLVELTEQMIILSKAVDKISKALTQRVSKEEIQTIVGPLYDEIKALKLSLGGS